MRPVAVADVALRRRLLMQAYIRNRMNTDQL